MIYFYKNYPKVTWKTWVVANAVSVFVLALVFAVIIPVILRLFGFFEITAVNSIGLPKNTGSVLMVLALIAGVYFGIRWAVKTNRPPCRAGHLGRLDAADRLLELCGVGHPLERQHAD